MTSDATCVTRLLRGSGISGSRASCIGLAGLSRVGEHGVNEGSLFGSTAFVR